MVTALLQKRIENTYQNTYVSNLCFAAPQTERLGTLTKVKYLTPSVRWFQKVNQLIFFHFETTKDRMLLKNIDIKPEDLNKYLYTIPQTASLLSCSPGTIYKLMDSGKLLAVYPTSKARISASSIVNYVKQLEKEARDSGVQF